MTMKDPIEALDRLKTRASSRAAMNAGKTRVVLQLDHSSSAVGGGDVAGALSEALPDSAYLVIAGSDGASFQAPKIVVTTPDGVAKSFKNVTSQDVSEIVRRIGAGPDEPDDGQDFFDYQRRVALDSAGIMSATDIDEYVSQGGYSGLAGALGTSPDAVIEVVKESGLRGRGGAYFPAALKWEGARRVDKSPKYLVVNSEEGEPGIFKDRLLMEAVPYRILEGMTIAAYAAGVEQAYIYINAEAELSAQRMQHALDQARGAGLLGESILGTGFSLNVEIRRGAGGYVCGEETTLLNTMEGYRREPRPRPPFPTESGLWAKPTVVNNPETLCSVSFILANGAAEFKSIGSDIASGTKIVSLSGSVQRTGVVEVPMGTTLRQIVYDIGGGTADDRDLIGLAVGGPSSGVFPPSMLDTPIAPGQLHEAGVMLGAGGVIVLDDRTSIPTVVRSLAAYNADESCGKCTPCREGTPRMVEALDRLMGGKGSPGDIDELLQLAEVVGAASLCGLGQAAGGPITSAMHFFQEEMFALAE
jgi:NADH:ubiquinone oxidoreductase subunit F (NADH-binding)